MNSFAVLSLVVSHLLGTLPHALGAISSHVLTPIGGIISTLLDDVGNWIFDIWSKWIWPNNPDPKKGTGVQTALSNQIPDSLDLMLYQSVRPIGLFLATAAASVRIVKVLADQRAPSHHLIAETMFRFIVGVILIGLPSAPGDPLAYTLLHWAKDAAGTLGTAIAHEYLNAGQNQVNGVGGVGIFGIGMWWFLSLIGADLLAGPIGLLVAIPVIVLLVLALYLIILFIAAMILLSFSVASAPLCIAMGVYEFKNRFTEWWVEAFVGAIAIPVVLGAGVTLTVIFWLHTFHDGGVLNPLKGAFIGPIFLCGGLWMTGKAAHKLTWRHFQHGGAFGALQAGMVAAMAAPKLAAEARAAGMGMGFDMAKIPGIGRGIKALGDIGLAANSYSFGMLGYAGSELHNQKFGGGGVQPAAPPSGNPSQQNSPQQQQPQQPNSQQQQGQRGSQSNQQGTGGGGQGNGTPITNPSPANNLGSGGTGDPFDDPANDPNFQNAGPFGLLSPEHQEAARQGGGMGFFNSQVGDLMRRNPGMSLGQAMSIATMNLPPTSGSSGQGNAPAPFGAGGSGGSGWSPGSGGNAGGAGGWGTPNWGSPAVPNAPGPGPVNIPNNPFAAPVIPQPAPQPPPISNQPTIPLPVQPRRRPPQPFIP